jgi:hypothetical protein
MGCDMTVKNLKGRMIENVPFSGLVERLNMISIMCEVAGQRKDHLRADDLMSIINQISEKAVEGLAFTGASREEIGSTRDYLLSGMGVEHKRPN